MSDSRAVRRITHTTDLLLLTGAVLFTAATAIAGVPFVTDDPGTPDQNHYVINIGGQYTHRNGETGGAIFGIDANYGVTERLGVHAYAPLAFDHVTGNGTSVGVGDVELGFKYRLLDEGDGWRPALAISPTVDLPAGAASHNLGAGHAHAFFPVWLSKEVGKWTAFGGGGFALNPGAANRNWVFTGAGLTYDIDPTWTLGGEVFYISPAVRGGFGGTAFNIGAIYNIDKTYHLLFSIGRNLTNASEVNEFSSYAGLQLSF